MGFFKKKAPSDYELIRQKAEDILNELGIEKKELTYNIAPTARYYEDVFYGGFGLNIVKPDYRRNEGGMYIKYSNILVFSDNHFSRGTWEDVLDEVHKSIPVLLQEREEEKRVEKHKLELLDMLHSTNFSEGKNEIGDGITVEQHTRTTGGDYEYYLGVDYYICENNDTVFVGNIDSICNKKVTKYVPGKWENDFEFYCERKDYELQRKHREMLARQRVEAEEEAQEAIKQLRKMREK